VQFWHMRVIGGPMREPMSDIKAVKWLSLKQAIEMLSRIHEKVFLANVGPIALKAARESMRGRSSKPWIHNQRRRRAQGVQVAATAH
jgi:8-oxo-dGTP diphosphatase